MANELPQLEKLFITSRHFVAAQKPGGQNIAS
jgi:hypothetical protein